MQDKHPDINNVLAVQGLGCERNHRVLFQDLSFAVRPGELWQIEGANGAGKTTLLRMLCGLLHADTGEISWRGRPITALRAEFLAELVFVGHKNGIKDELTALENLDFDRSLAARPSDLPSAAALQRLGLTEGVNRQCRFLSAGQRRRVALSRLLVNRAILWILDEPLTALDRHARATVTDLLTRHTAEGGMAVITTHQDLALTHHDVRKIQLG